MGGGRVANPGGPSAGWKPWFWYSISLWCCQEIQTDERVQCKRDYHHMPSAAAAFNPSLACQYFMLFYPLSTTTVKNVMFVHFNWIVAMVLGTLIVRKSAGFWLIGVLVGWFVAAGWSATTRLHTHNTGLWWSLPQEDIAGFGQKVFGCACDCLPKCQINHLWYRIHKCMSRWFICYAHSH